MWAKAEFHPCSWKGRVSRSGGEVVPESSAVWGFLTLRGVMGQLQVDPLSAGSFFQVLVSGCQPQRMLLEGSEILFPEPTLPAAALEGRRARDSLAWFLPHGWGQESGIKSSACDVQGRKRTKNRSQSLKQAICKPCPSSFRLRGLLPVLDEGPLGRASLLAPRLRPRQAGTQWVLC